MDKALTARYPDARRTEKTARIIRWILAAFCIIAALYGFLKITDVQISGNMVYSNEEVFAASGLREGTPLLLTGRGAVKRLIESRLPAVEKADVRIRLPGAVVIRIREGTAVASLEMGDGRSLLLSAKGKVVGETDDPSAYIRLVGMTPLEGDVGRLLKLEKEDEVKLECLSELLTLLEEHGRIEEVRELDVANLTSIRMNYGDRFQVRLGGADRLAEKLNFLEQILEELSYGETGTIDLTRETEGHYIPR